MEALRVLVGLYLGDDGHLCSLYTCRFCPSSALPRLRRKSPPRSGGTLSTAMVSSGSGLRLPLQHDPPSCSCLAFSRNRTRKRTTSITLGGSASSASHANTTLPPTSCTGHQVRLSTSSPDPLSRPFFPPSSGAPLWGPCQCCSPAPRCSCRRSLQPWSPPSRPGDVRFGARMQLASNLIGGSPLYSAP